VGWTGLGGLLFLQHRVTYASRMYDRGVPCMASLTNSSTWNCESSERFESGDESDFKGFPVLLLPDCRMTGLAARQMNSSSSCLFHLEALIFTARRAARNRDETIRVLLRRHERSSVFDRGLRHPAAQSKPNPLGKVRGGCLAKISGALPFPCLIRQSRRFNGAPA
jgi:hypothetical protein